MDLSKYFKDFNFNGMSEAEKQRIIKNLLELYHKGGKK